MPVKQIKLPSDSVRADLCLGLTVTGLYTECWNQRDHRRFDLRRDTVHPRRADPLFQFRHTIRSCR